MAEKETIHKLKDLIEPVPEEILKLEEEEKVEKFKEEGFSRGRPKRIDPQERLRQDAIHAVESWVPKTKLGKSVKEGKEKDLDKILQTGKRILEPEIVDKLISLDSDMILIGQAKGKFGGGKRRAWRQTQKKTKEGNVLTFSSMAIVGDRKGHVGVGFGRAKETLPTREKSMRNAKLSLIKIKLGFESPESEPKEAVPHTIPFKVEGKSGSVRITLWPAARGTGLVIGDECKKVLNLAGIKDIYSKSEGKTKTTFNLVRACVDALSKTTELKE
ncbi:30S ribosomal protein S5 [Candidatus Pacearchaeota archaeon]|nr:30S ribosomal protein S5 [Candidatus Pacearchaeota archaeon]